MLITAWMCLGRFSQCILIHTNQYLIRLNQTWWTWILTNTQNVCRASKRFRSLVANPKLYLEYVLLKKVIYLKEFLSFDLMCIPLSTSKPFQRILLQQLDEGSREFFNIYRFSSVYNNVNYQSIYYKDIAETPLTARSLIDCKCFSIVIMRIIS